MKSILRLALLAAMLKAMVCVAQSANSGTEAAQEPTNGIQIAVSVKGDPDEIKTNQTVSLLICLTNSTTNETFYISNNPPGANESFTFEVISPSGKDVTFQTMSHQPFGFATGGLISIFPQTAFQFGEFNISDFYKFDEIGKYRIATSMKILPQTMRKSFAIISSPLYLKVVPGYYWQSEATNTSPWFNFPDP